MLVKYCGALFDYSGYGEANRHDVAALLASGVDVTVETAKFCLEISDFGTIGQKIRDLPVKSGARIKIIHTTPNIFGQYIEPGVYHIGRVFWETDKLPPSFAKGAQLCDEIWTGSEYNKQAIIKAGVTKPIYVIPEAIDDSYNIDNIRKFIIPNKHDYKFYSIFEWTERKNPEALLEAYWLEFQNDKGVSLTIRTFLDNFTPQKREEVDMAIRKVKKRLNLRYYPPLYLYRKLMTRDEIYRFHKSYDCYISPHRGEGWGIPQMEAMLQGRPIISSKAGGIHEYLTHKQDAYLLDYVHVPIRETNRNSQWYRQDQCWGETSVKDIRIAMRYAYGNQTEMWEIGKKARQTVLNKFALKVVGEKMKQRLDNIKIS